MKTLLVTGITGKSGNVFAHLIGQGKISDSYQLRTSVRTKNQIDSVKEIIPNADIRCGDLGDEHFLKELTNGVDVVFHIAGIDKSPALVNACIANSVKRIVLVHTTGIYSKYKAAGELYRSIDTEVSTLCRANGIKLTILRPTMIYGTLQDHNIVKFIQMVDHLYIMPVVNQANYYLQPVNCRDLGLAYAQVIEHLDITSNRDYILSGRDKVLLIDIFTIIADELGKKRHYISVPFVFAYIGAWIVYYLSFLKIDMREKVQRLCEDRAYSYMEAQRDFGYSPMSFEDGLRQEVREYVAMNDQ